MAHAVVRLPSPATTRDLAMAFGLSSQSIRKAGELERMNEIGELTFTPKSVESFADRRGCSVRWIDRVTGEDINPRTGKLVNA